MRTSAVRSKLKSDPMEHNPPTQENVILALSLFYSATATQEERDQADNWLVSFRRTIEAWPISVKLLESPNVEVAHFAAHTLQEKIKTQWSHLHQDKKLELLNILMFYFCTWANSVNLLITRVSLAIAQIAIHVIPQELPNLLQDILNISNTQHGRDMRKAILTFLKVLPEELEDALITDERRNAVADALRKDSPKIAPLLLQTLHPEQNNEELKLSALRCLISWKLPFQLIVENPIIDYVFECIKNYDSMVQDGSEFLINFMDGRKIYQYPKLRLQMFHKFLSLQDRLTTVINEGNPVTAEMVHMFSNLGDLVTDLMTKDPEAGPKLAAIMTMCAAHRDKEIAQLSLRFWYDLQTHLNDLEHGDPSITWFVGSFCNMVQVLRNQCIFPDFNMTPKEEEDFINFRSDAAETVVYLYNFLHDKCSEVLYQMLLNSLQDTNNVHQWAIIEATIFCFKATAEVVEKNDIFLGKVFEHYPSFPSHKKLSQTALLLLGETARWISENPSHINIILQYILLGLQTPDLLDAAALSFNQVVINCRKNLPYLQNILPAMEPIILDTTRRIESRCLLLEAIVQLIDRLPYDQASPLMIRLTNPIIGRIAQSLQSQINQDTRIALINDLRLFAHACMIIADPNNDTEDIYQVKDSAGHALFEPFKMIWPYLEITVKNFARDDDIVWATVRIIKHALGNLNAEHFEALLPSFTKLVCIGYTQEPNEDFLKTLSISLSIFKTKYNSTDPQDAFRINIFFETIYTIAKCSFERLQAMSSRPQLVKSFFEVLEQAYDKVPNSVIGDGSVPYPNCTAAGLDLFEAACESLLHIDDRLASKAVARFLKIIIKDIKQASRSLVLKNFQILLMVIFNGLSNLRVARSLIPMFGDLIQAIRGNFPNELRQGVLELFKIENFPSKFASKEAKQQFVKDIFLWNQKQFNNNLHSFAVICRGLDSKYGEETKPFII